MPTPYKRQKGTTVPDRMRAAILLQVARGDGVAKAGRDHGLGRNTIYAWQKQPWWRPALAEAKRLSFLDESHAIRQLTDWLHSPEAGRAAAVPDASLAKWKDAAQIALAAAVEELGTANDRAGRTLFETDPDTLVAWATERREFPPEPEGVLAAAAWWFEMAAELYALARQPAVYTDAGASRENYNRAAYPTDEHWLAARQRMESVLPFVEAERVYPELFASVQEGPGRQREIFEAIRCGGSLVLSDAGTVDVPRAESSEETDDQPARLAVNHGGTPDARP